ncbi:hypothetical protein ACET3Z_012990 [Daucus carota]
MELGVVTGIGVGRLSLAPPPNLKLKAKRVFSGKSGGLVMDDDKEDTMMGGTGSRRRSSRSRKAKKTTDEEEEDEKKKRRRASKKTSSGLSTSSVMIDIEDFGKEQSFEIRSSLLDWYDNNQRDLPWRKTTTCSDRAYAVWVSEIMLQQTRVDTVIRYFIRWIHKWPTLVHLSHASLEEVNQMWAGLGYYRRARFLLEGAKFIVQQGGHFPTTLSELRKVPGIGDYTAGAIASIAFQQAVPVVDGNVVRVIARLKTISANPKDSTTVKAMWKLAGQLVDPDRPGDFNQALMELGATVCTLHNPSCSTCPVSGQCRALSVSINDRSVSVKDYPTKVVKAKKRHEFSAVTVVEIIEDEALMDQPQCNSRFLLVKRPDKGLLAGLWEFPSVPLIGEVDLVTRKDAIDQYLKSFDLESGSTCEVVLRKDVGEYVHIFSHIRLKMYIELLVLHLKGRKCVNLEKENMEWKYVNSKDVGSLGLTSGVRKVYDMIQKFKDTIPPKSDKKLSVGQMGGGEEDEAPESSRAAAPRASLKTISNWKHKLRENCLKRIRDDRSRLLWKMRLLPNNNNNQATLIQSALQAIVSDELTKINRDLLWEYDGLPSQPECEDILLQMQTFFYQDLMQHQSTLESSAKTWEDEEDDYLARAVYHHMQLNDHPVQQTVWCPICKEGELHENYSHVYCTSCELKLLRGEEVTLELIRNRLAEAHAEHLDRGCKLTPKIRMESRFNLSVLYIECHSCDTFEVVI